MYTEIKAGAVIWAGFNLNSCVSSYDTGGMLKVTKVDVSDLVYSSTPQFS